MWSYTAYAPSKTCSILAIFMIITILFASSVPCTILPTTHILLYSLLFFRWYFFLLLFFVLLSREMWAEFIINMIVVVFVAVCVCVLVCLVECTVILGICAQWLIASILTSVRFKLIDTLRWSQFRSADLHSKHTHTRSSTHVHRYA